MQKKDNRSYTFFLSHKTKTKIFTRNIEISKNIVHTGIIVLIISISIISAGFFRNTVFAKFNQDLQPEKAATVPTTENFQTTAVAEYKPISYARPTSSKDLAVGGETITSLQPFPTDSEAEKSRMEQQLRVIVSTSNAAFLPTMWAHLGKINNEFGVRRNPFGDRSYEFHAGIDIGGEIGDVVAVPANGIVTEAGWKGGYGNMIEVDHGNGLKTRYGHLSRIGVEVGAAVSRGQIIGLIGSTGRSTGPHLHYELRLFDKPINPRQLLQSMPPEIAALTAK